MRVDLEKPLVFKDLDSFTPHISRLVFMLEYARQTTLDAVTDLEQEQLDVHVIPNGNSIGMLLAHIAAVEAWYQQVTFEGVTPSWDTPETRLGELGRAHIKGEPLESYLDTLAAVREKTLDEFAKRNDAWLHEEYPFTTWNDTPLNRYFQWFHVFEDEINHRGQIRLIRKMLESKPTA